MKSMDIMTSTHWNHHSSQSQSKNHMMGNQR